MALFAVIGLDHPPHSMERRLANRDAHREYVPSNDGQIAFVGVMLDDADNQCGSFYVFEAETEEEVREWLAKEPFVRADVYGQLIVRRFMLGLNRLPEQDWPIRASRPG